MKKNNVLTFVPTTKHQTDPFNQTFIVAVVSKVSDTEPASITVAVNEAHYPVAGYISPLAGISPSVSPGDTVLVSAVGEGVWIHGVMMPIDAPTRASFGFKDDKLVIEAQGAVVLKSGKATVELTEAGKIRIDGKDVRTVAETVRTEGNDITTLAREALTLSGGKVDVN